ncbi:TPA: hypothetical protein OG026_001541 [Listeria monocytogenes]|nr:hypothetical protein [Listeria monocytogenes]HCQ0867941.1 hypothetical protein [Listeria monocytogenes]HCQ1119500.1 hypothetical protein [Listeria monocytogenes]
MSSFLTWFSVFCTLVSYFPQPIRANVLIIIAMLIIFITLLSAIFLSRFFF